MHARPVCFVPALRRECNTSRIALLSGSTVPWKRADAPRGDMEGHVGLSRYCGAVADCAAPVLGCLKPTAAAGVCRPGKADTYGHSTTRFSLCQAACARERLRSAHSLL